MSHSHLSQTHTLTPFQFHSLTLRCPSSLSLTHSFSVTLRCTLLSLAHTFSLTHRCTSSLTFFSLMPFAHTHTHTQVLGLLSHLFTHTHVHLLSHLFTYTFHSHSHSHTGAGSPLTPFHSHSRAPPLSPIHSRLSLTLTHRCWVSSHTFSLTFMHRSIPLHSLTFSLTPFHSS